MKKPRGIWLTKIRGNIYLVNGYWDDGGGI